MSLLKKHTSTTILNHIFYEYVSLLLIIEEHEPVCWLNIPRSLAMAFDIRQGWRWGSSSGVESLREAIQSWKIHGKDWEDGLLLLPASILSIGGSFHLVC
jgi:hypothetical protein